MLPGARPFTRRMHDLNIQRESAVRKQHREGSNSRRLHFALRGASIRIDKGFRADVSCWLGHLHRWNGTQRWRSAQSAPYVFASNASLTGFGFYLESIPPTAAPAQWPLCLQLGSGFSGLWSPSDAALHSTSGQMTWCEMFAVFAALATYKEILRDSCALFFRCARAQ